MPRPFNHHLPSAFLSASFHRTMHRLRGLVPDYFPLRFALICLDTHQIQYLNSHRDLDYLGGFFETDPPSWVRRTWWLWTWFARPVADTQRAQAYNPSCRAAPAVIEQLPNELLDQIFDHLSEDKQDVLALGMCSASLWSLVHRRVQKDYERYSSTWAGKRAVYMGLGDYEEYLFSFGINPTEETQPLYSDLVVLQKSAFALNAPEAQPQTTKSIAQEWADGLASAKCWNGFSTAAWDCIEQDLSPSMFPQDRVWVLRNLTTCEFIRSDKLQPASRRAPTNEASTPGATGHKLSRAVKMMSMLKQGATAFSPKKAKKRDAADGTPSSASDTTPLTFVQIFLVLTSHSREVPHDERCFEFQEGRWAGHAFDIVTWDVHVAETKPHEWADVSELAVDDVANLRHWVQQLQLVPGSRGFTHDHEPLPRRLWQRVSEDRRMFHDWEGLETQSSSGTSRWSQKPVQMGLLRSV
jgi:hypothetical protein